MPFVVVYDANALYGNAQRDLLIRIAQSGLVQAKWTEQILDEMLHNLGKKRPDIPAEKLRILRELMSNAIRDCLVTGYEPLIDSVQLPDPDDRHVLAAAIRSSAQVIVTPGSASPSRPTRSGARSSPPPLDAGVPLRDVQEAASHADPRTTMRYDRGRGSLDRHATYIVAAYLAGAAR